MLWFSVLQAFFFTTMGSSPGNQIPVVQQSEQVYRFQNPYFHKQAVIPEEHKENVQRLIRQPDLILKPENPIRKTFFASWPQDYFQTLNNIFSGQLEGLNPPRKKLSKLSHDEKRKALREWVATELAAEFPELPLFVVKNFSLFVSASSNQKINVFERLIAYQRTQALLADLGLKESLLERIAEAWALGHRELLIDPKDFSEVTSAELKEIASRLYRLETESLEFLKRVWVSEDQKRDEDLLLKDSEGTIFHQLNLIQTTTPPYEEEKAQVYETNFPNTASGFVEFKKQNGSLCAIPVQGRVFPEQVYLFSNTPSLINRGEQDPIQQYAASIGNFKSKPNDWAVLELIEKASVKTPIQLAVHEEVIENCFFADEIRYSSPQFYFGNLQINQSRTLFAKMTAFLRGNEGQWEQSIGLLQFLKRFRRGIHFCAFFEGDRYALLSPMVQSEEDIPFLFADWSSKKDNPNAYLNIPLNRPTGLNARRVGGFLWKSNEQQMNGPLLLKYTGASRFSPSAQGFVPANRVSIPQNTQSLLQEIFPKLRF